MDDFIALAAGMNGPIEPAGDLATDFDLDGDCDVDLADFVAQVEQRFLGVDLERHLPPLGLVADEVLAVARLVGFPVAVVAQHPLMDGAGQVAVVLCRVLAQHVREHRCHVEEAVLTGGRFDDGDRVHVVALVPVVLATREAGLGLTAVQRAGLEVDGCIVECRRRCVAVTPAGEIDELTDFILWVGKGSPYG